MSALFPPSTAFGERDLRYLAGRPDLSTFGDGELAAFEQNMQYLVAEHDARFAPVTGDDLADALDTFARMLGCNVPDEQGLKLYMLAVRDIPRGLLPPATVRLAATHKYSRLPLPADFRKSIEAELEAVARRRRLILNALAYVQAEIARR